MIHEEICTYEVAKLAKEKGFNVPTRTIKVEKIEGTEKEVWDEEECRYITQWETRSVRIPTQSLLQRWLREEKLIVIDVVLDWQYNIEAEEIRYQYRIGSKSRMTIEGVQTRGIVRDRYFDTYELALEDALKYALENLV